MERDAAVNRDSQAQQVYWDARPCNSLHSSAPPDTRLYLIETAARKSQVELHIHDFADFPAWKGHTVLDLGCGIGITTVWFAAHCAKVTAVDISTASLGIARQRAAIAEVPVEFVRADIPTLDLARKFDLIFSFGVLHHVRNIDQALERIRLHCHSSSKLKLMVYHAYSLKRLLVALGMRSPEAQPGCPYVRYYSTREITGLLRTHGFCIDIVRKEHIFPWRWQDYREYRYVKVWYYRWMPSWLFRWLEQHFGEHLLIDASIVRWQSP
jgi:SAM-dependent methyltransferase